MTRLTRESDRNQLASYLQLRAHIWFSAWLRLYFVSQFAIVTIHANSSQLVSVQMDACFRLMNTACAKEPVTNKLIYKNSL